MQVKDNVLHYGTVAELLEGICIDMPPICQVSTIFKIAPFTASRRRCPGRSGAVEADRRRSRLDFRDLAGTRMYG